MRRFLILMALLVTTGGAAKAAPPVWTTRLPLAHIRPSEFLAMLTETLPPGVESVAPSDPEKRLVVRGTAAGISQVRALLRLLDVPSRTVRVGVRLVRSQRLSGGAVQTEILSTVQTSAANNRTLPVTFRAADTEYFAVLKPRIHADDSVTLEAKLSLRQTQTMPAVLYTRTTEGTRRVRPGGPWARLLSVSAPLSPKPEGARAADTIYLETIATPAPLRPKIGKGSR